jgi:uncharacterized repeat protein (TIGR03803 family)
MKRMGSPAALAIAVIFVLVGCAKATQSQLLPASGSVASERIHKATAVETVIYSFGSQSRDGEDPQAGLFNVNGRLYGTTAAGGAYRSGRVCSRDSGCGTVFAVTPSGTETVLYSFPRGGRQGANPPARLIVFKGELYGTTAYGGANECEPGYGCGTVFSITTTGSEKVLHRFNGSGGELPQAKLLSVNGTFYGTTGAGGTGSYGAVFSIMPTGTYHVLHNFAGGNDGEGPDAGLINVNGRFYGTTSGGGRYGDGTVFSITTTGAEKVLHAFNGSDGKNPEAALTYVNGKMYGTTLAGGGSGGYGSVFSMTTTGTEKVLHRFAGGSDGAFPFADLVNVNGALYGTTQNGGGTGCGGGGCGTVFSVRPSGIETVIHNFTGSTADGAYPQADLINVNGTLYGTTVGGGEYDDGTVFSLSL